MSVRLNAAWHGQHKMPKNPTLAERLKWHAAHHEHCRCREIPASLAPYFRKKAA